MQIIFSKFQRLRNVIHSHEAVSERPGYQKATWKGVFLSKDKRKNTIFFKKKVGFRTALEIDTAKISPRQTYVSIRL